jgi:hypothetical protein
MTTDLWHIVRLSIQAVILHLSPLHLLLGPVAGGVLLEGLAHQGCSEMARKRGQRAPCHYVSRESGLSISRSPCTTEKCSRRRMATGLEMYGDAVVAVD